jgi:hypothetical protein
MVKKDSSSEYEGLTISLRKTNDDNSTNEGEGLDGDFNEEDLELLEYQRERSTPKIEINDFEDEEEVMGYKDKETN